MNRIERFAIFILFFSSILPAEVPLLDSRKPSDTPKLIETFSPDQNPGKGRLTFKRGELSETIELGLTNGIYGMGMLVHSQALPEPLQKDFKKAHLIQIMLGNFGTRLTQFVPQFATLTLVTKKIPSSHQAFTTILPGEKSSKTEDVALILFSSPASPKERADEEKLRNTYFAQSGVLSYEPLKKAEVVEIKVQNGHLTFKNQMARIHFNSLLITPFNTQTADLQGQIEIPIYWPEGKIAQRYVRNIFSSQLKEQFSLNPRVKLK